jgi:hypothetical protein
MRLGEALGSMLSTTHTHIPQRKGRKEGREGGRGREGKKEGRRKRK